MYCAGVIEGAWGTLSLTGNSESLCPKTPMSAIGKVEAFRKWAVQHPEMWGKEQMVGVVLALQQAWPCT